MLKKMRIRIIAYTMISFFIVMSVVATLTNAGNYLRITRDSDRKLEKILEHESSRDENSGTYHTDQLMPMNPESRYMTRYFTVHLTDDEIDDVCMDHIASVDRTEAEEYVSAILKKNKEKGYYGNYRYLIEKTGNEATAVFMNVFTEIEMMKSLFSITAMIMAGSLVAVFIFIFFLSKKAIEPFIRNIEQQKRFITDASHELKTPLTSISASLDVIAMEEGESEWIDNIRNQLKRMSKMVSELVTLSRLDEAKPIPEKEEFSLSEAAWEIIEVFRPQALSEGKTFDVNIDSEITMNGEKSVIQQLFSVLLNNAVRYCKENGYIRFSVRQEAGKRIIEVFNTCDYESALDTSKLFDRFYRPDESRNRKTGGTGIGLSIAKAIVDSYGGNIEALCPDGKTMTITAVL